MARRWITLLAAIAVCDPRFVPPSRAQPAPIAVQQTLAADHFDLQQIDALLAPVALYPDQLLTQVLMAATFPLQIVEAARWLDDPAQKALTGDALSKALVPLDWDPSVKSLVPFPQVLAQLNGNLEWTQQLGYAFANQQKDVLDSVQRLRREAQAHGHLQTTQQQVVRTQAAAADPAQPTIIIEPAQPNIVYVPTYSPTVVYGAWPYPAYPPVVVAPPPGYVVGTALLSGLAFGAGVAISASLWGWSSPNWNRGNVNVNVNRYNSINVNRQRAVSNTWNSTWNRPAGRFPTLQRPPGGPVGAPMRTAGLPAHAIGRPNVGVPANAINHPVRQPSPATNRSGNMNLSPGSRPNPAAARPGFNGQGQRPAPVGRPQTPGQRPAAQRPAAQRPAGGAFGGIGDGNRATQFGQRGGQSRQLSNARAGRGGIQGGFHGRR